MYAAAAKLAAAGLLEHDRPEVDDDGPRSTAWSAYEATQRTARARREAAARAWLEDGAKDQVRYFAEGGASRQALEDADCVEGCIARLARGDAGRGPAAAARRGSAAAAAAASKDGGGHLPGVGVR